MKDRKQEGTCKKGSRTARARKMGKRRQDHPVDKYRRANQGTRLWPPGRKWAEDEGFKWTAWFNIYVNFYVIPGSRFMHNVGNKQVMFDQPVGWQKVLLCSRQDSWRSSFCVDLLKYNSNSFEQLSDRRAWRTKSRGLRGLWLEIFLVSNNFLPFWQNTGVYLAIVLAWIPLLMRRTVSLNVGSSPASIYNYLEAAGWWHQST